MPLCNSSRRHIIPTKKPHILTRQRRSLARLLRWIQRHLPSTTVPNSGRRTLPQILRRQQDHHLRLLCQLHRQSLPRYLCLLRSPRLPYLQQRHPRPHRRNKRLIACLGRYRRSHKRRALQTGQTLPRFHQPFPLHNRPVRSPRYYDPCLARV